MFFDDVFDGATAGDGLVVEVVQIPVFRRISDSGHLDIVELEKLERIVSALAADPYDANVYFVTRGDEVSASQYMARDDGWKGDRCCGCRSSLHKASSGWRHIGSNGLISGGWGKNPFSRLSGNYLPICGRVELG